LKNTELAQEKVQTFIRALPNTLNQTAMSTYEMILEEGRKEVRFMLEQERQRAQEALKREAAERQRALEAMQREEEEERQHLDQVIIHLHNVVQLPIAEIAVLTMREISYIEALILRQNEDEGSII